jgi:hypothetical protein
MAVRLPQGHNAAGRIRSIEKSNDLIGNRTRNLPACSAGADLHMLQFTVTHALGFSVFTSRILVTELKQSHCDEIFLSPTESSHTDF